jgi:hypothetical protein
MAEARFTIEGRKGRKPEDSAFEDILTNLEIIPSCYDWKGMTTKLPASSVLSLSCQRHSSSGSGSGEFAESRGPGLWTGTREGLVSTVIAMVAALLFGGAAGDWFAPDDSGWMSQMLRMSGGSLAMAALVSGCGSLLAGRNAIYWGVGMPLLVYVAGSFCAFISGHAGALMFLFGAPLFCGLAVAGGVLASFAVDRRG